MSSSTESPRPVVSDERLYRARRAFLAAQRALDAARDELFAAQTRAMREHALQGSRR